MTEPGSDAELRRSIERLTNSIDKLESKVVLQRVYDADKVAASDRHRNLEQKLDDAKRDITDDVERLEKKVDADIADRKADRRLIVAAFLALVAQIILQIYQQAQGGGG